MDYRTLRDKSLDWGPTGYDLRHIFQVYGTYDLPFGDGRRFDFQNAVIEQVLGGWAALDDLPDAERQAVPAAERTADAQPGRCGRHPERHYREPAAGHGEGQTGSERATSTSSTNG